MTIIETSTAQFAVPGVKPDSVESEYAALASACGRTVPPPQKRVYSIEFRHNGIDWVATVGKPLSGSRRSGQITTPVRDTAVVRAIFSGTPYYVTTDGDYRSFWESPFMAGQPSKVVYFAEDRAS